MTTSEVVDCLARLTEHAVFLISDLRWPRWSEGDVSSSASSPSSDMEGQYVSGDSQVSSVMVLVDPPPPPPWQAGSSEPASAIGLSAEPVLICHDVLKDRVI